MTFQKPWLEFYHPFILTNEFETHEGIFEIDTVTLKTTLFLLFPTLNEPTTISKVQEELELKKAIKYTIDELSEPEELLVDDLYDELSNPIEEAEAVSELEDNYANEEGKHFQIEKNKQEYLMSFLVELTTSDSNSRANIFDSRKRGTTIEIERVNEFPIEWEFLLEKNDLLEFKITSYLQKTKCSKDIIKPYPGVFSNIKTFQFSQVQIKKIPDKLSKNLTNKTLLNIVKFDLIIKLFLFREQKEIFFGSNRSNIQKERKIKEFKRLPEFRKLSKITRTAFIISNIGLFLPIYEFP